MLRQSSPISYKPTNLQTYKPTNLKTYKPTIMSSAEIMSSLMSQFQGEDGNLIGIPQEKLLEAIISLQSMKNDTSSLPKKKGRKTKASKDPNKPKRPQSAYFLWLGDNRSRIKEELVKKEESAKATDVTKEAGRQWKLVSVEEKCPFVEQSESEKQRYKEEMQTYEPQDPVVIYTVDEYPKAHEGWSGPFQMKYLSKNAKSLEGKNLSFKSFDEAVEEASKLETCGGITKTARGYSLRVGTDLISTPESKSSGGLASWIKGTPESFVAMTETTVEIEVVKKSKAKAKDKVGEESNVEAEPDVEEINPVEKSKSLPKKKTFKAKEQEPKPEEESEDEELDVEEVVIDGETYFKDDKGQIYDPDTHGLVGENGELYE